MDAKQRILNEIRRTTEENNGKPLGAARFEKETGINAHAWEKYWARFGDALLEAGFVPNQFIAAHPREFFAEKTIGLMRQLNRFPTTREIGRERSIDPQFPSRGAFRRLGTQRDLAQRIVEFCRDRAGYEDVVALCQPMLSQSDGLKRSASDNDAAGEVYLAKSGRYYKIGKTNDRVRRGAELRIQLPEKLELIHAIVTDDPRGIEAYWHRRFDAKRKQGEWFDLTATDVKAFRRWRRVY